MKPFNAWLVFVDSPKRTEAQNERALERALARLEILAAEPIEDPAEFTMIANTLVDCRGAVYVLPHEIQLTDPGAAC